MPKIKFSKSYNIGTWWCKPLVYQILIIWCNRIHNLEYLSFSTRDYQIRVCGKDSILLLYMIIPYSVSLKNDFLGTRGLIIVQFFRFLDIFEISVTYPIDGHQSEVCSTKTNTINSVKSLPFWLGWKSISRLEVQDLIILLSHLCFEILNNR